MIKELVIVDAESDGWVKADVVAQSPFAMRESTMRMMLNLNDFDDWQHGKLIQKAMPYLTADQREFLMTGFTPEDWKEMFGEED